MNVTIMDSCTGCGACESVNSDVFSVKDRAYVNKSAVEANKQDCIDAALICPVNAIWIDSV